MSAARFAGPSDEDKADLEDPRVVHAIPSSMKVFMDEVNEPGPRDHRRASPPGARIASAKLPG